MLAAMVFTAVVAAAAASTAAENNFRFGEQVFARFLENPWSSLRLNYAWLDPFLRFGDARTYISASGLDVYFVCFVTDCCIVSDSSADG